MSLGSAQVVGGCNPSSHKTVSSGNPEQLFGFSFCLAKNCQLKSLFFFISSLCPEICTEIKLSPSPRTLWRAAGLRGEGCSGHPDSGTLPAPCPHGGSVLLLCSNTATPRHTGTQLPGLGGPSVPRTCRPPPLLCQWQKRSSTHPSTHPSIHPSIHPSMNPPIHPCTHPFTHPAPLTVPRAQGPRPFPLAPPPELRHAHSP